MCVYCDMDSDLGFCTRCHQQVPKSNGNPQPGTFAGICGLLMIFSVIGLIIGIVDWWSSLI